MRHKLNLQRMLPHVSLLLSNIIFWSRHPQRTRTPPWQCADRSSINQPAISHYRSTSLISLTSDILKRSWSFPGIAGALLNAAASGWCVCVSVGVCVCVQWLLFCSCGILTLLCLGAALLSTGTSAGQLFWNCTPAPIQVKSPPTPPLNSPLLLPLSLSLPLFPSLSLSLSLSLAAPVHVCPLSLSLSLLTQSWDFFKAALWCFEDPPCFLRLGGAAVTSDHKLRLEKWARRDSWDVWLSLHF